MSTWMEVLRGLSYLFGGMMVGAFARYAKDHYDLRGQTLKFHDYQSFVRNLRISAGCAACSLWFIFIYHRVPAYSAVGLGAIIVTLALGVILSQAVKQIYDEAVSIIGNTTHMNVAISKMGSAYRIMMGVYVLILIGMMSAHFPTNLN